MIQSAERFLSTSGSVQLPTVRCAVISGLAALSSLLLNLIINAMPTYLHASNQTTRALLRIIFLYQRKELTSEIREKTQIQGQQMTT